jgi:Ca-activated chloride channel family protein
MRLQALLPILFSAGLACLIVALARPQRGLSNSVVRTEGVDIVLLLDLSGSMENPDFVRNGFRISRLDAAKEVLDRFLDRRSDDRIGLVAFATYPYSVAPLTLDHNWLKQRIAQLRLGTINGNSTAIGDGMASAINHIRDSKAKSKVVILLTDGVNNYGKLSPANAAELAQTLGIKIYTIGVGTDDRELDLESLQQIADTTDAKYFRARNLSSLDAVYEQIDQLEKTETETKLYTRYEEKARPIIMAGILLLAIEQLLGLTKLGRLP